MVAEGVVADVDLGRAGEGTFVNVASAGLSVGVTEALDPALKRRLGVTAYGVALLRAYRHHRPFTARLTFPDGDHEPVEWPDLLRHSRSATAATTAAGTRCRRRRASTTASSTSTRSRTAGVREHVRVARALKDGSFVGHPSVDHLVTARVHVETDPVTPLNLDGEVTGRTPVTFEVDRNAVHVLVPAASTAARLDGPGAA